MEQKSEDWLKFRGNSNGASEISIIMEVSPYKKRSRLLQEKAFPFEKSDAPNEKDFIFNKGHKYEIKIRNFVEFDLDLSFPTQPTVIFSAVSYKTPLHASLDGITPDGTIIIECKFVGQDMWHELRRTKKAPIHYELQVQQQLLITGAKKCIFAFCREVKDAKGNIDLEYDYFDILPDVKIHETILIEAKKFWDEVLELRAKGKTKINYSEIDGLIVEYKTVQEIIDARLVQLAKIKSDIFNLAGKEKIERHDYKIMTVESKGKATTAYAKFIKDQKLEVPEKYTTIGKPSVSQRISFKGDEDEQV